MCRDYIFSKTLCFLYKTSIYILYSLLSNCFLNAQTNTSNVTIYGTAEGLPQSSVYGLLQCKQGFIWASTGDGIARFDGRNWKTYKINRSFKQKPFSNLFNSILFEDIEGTIWCSNASGIFYKKRTDYNLDFFCPEKDTSKYAHAICKIAGIQHGHFIWGVSGNSRLFCYDIKTNKSKVFDFNLFSVPNSPSVIAAHIFKNKIYIILYHKIISFDIYTHRFNEIVGLNKTSERPLDINDADNKLFFCTTHSIYQIKNDTVVDINIKSKNQFYRLIKKDEHHLFVSGTSHNIQIYDTKTNQLLYNTLPKNTQQKIIAINTYFQDRNGNLWIGTEGLGLLKYLSGKHSFSLINQEEDNISSNFIKGILKYSQDTILIGTSGSGLNIYNRAFKKNKVIFKDQNVSQIYRDSKKRIWVATDRGIFLSNKDLNFLPIKISTTEKFIPLNNNVLSIAESPNANIYFGTINGLHKFNEQTQTIEFINSPSFNLSIFCPDNHHIIFSKYDGTINIINLQNPHQINELFKSNARNPRSIIKDKNSIWMATENGLLNYDAETKVVYKYDNKDGLRNNYLYAAIPDANNHVWVSSNGGLSVFDKRTKRFKNFDMSHGLQSMEYNTGSYHYAIDGELFFGGINGLNYFYPDSILQDSLKPLQVITAIKLFEQNLNSDSILMTGKKLEFNYQQNSIYLQFACLDFTNPDQNQFAYKLEGQDKEWTSLERNNFVRFSNLMPGNYSLWLKSANRDETWCNPEKMITIIIHPPFWKTWWFISFSVFLVFLCITLIVFYLTKKKFKKRLALLEKEKELQAIRLQLSQDIHDDIGGNLSKIAILSDRIKDNQNGDKIASLSRDVQRGFRELIWSVNPEQDELSNFIYFIRNYSATFFENSTIQVSINIPSQIPQLELLPQVRRHLFLCFKEALNNILKHSEAKDVIIEIEIIQKNVLKLIIKDNGKGLNVSEANKGNGLNNFKNRMKSINGQLNLHNNHPQGLIIIFSVPTNKIIN